jgi:hypothetical protein
MATTWLVGGSGVACSSHEGGKDLAPASLTLRRLQTEARLTPEQAQQYLNEVHDERLAGEARRPA